MSRDLVCQFFDVDQGT